MFALQNADSQDGNEEASKTLHKIAWKVAKLLVKKAIDSINNQSSD